MPDHRFHHRTPPITLKELAALTGAEIAPGSDPGYKVQDVAPLENAGQGDISFLDNVKYKTHFEKTKAAACILRPELTDLAPKGIHLLLSSSPYKTYALVAQAFYPEYKPAETQVAPTAVVHETAKLGKSCIVEAGAVIGANVTIGNHCRIGANAVISHALIGDHVRIYPGVCIGQDGFGFAPDPKGHIKIPQLGRVIIEDHVEIGANAVIDRGSGPDTVIGQGTWIDNAVHIGHNVKIGKGCIMAAQTGISGSVIIEDFAMLGGQVGVSGHLTVGKGARIAAQSGVLRNIPPGKEYMGYPAIPIRQFWRMAAILNRLINKDKIS